MVFASCPDCQQLYEGVLNALNTSYASPKTLNFPDAGGAGGSRYCRPCALYSGCELSAAVVGTLEEAAASCSWASCRSFAAFSRFSGVKCL